MKNTPSIKDEAPFLNRPWLKHYPENVPADIEVPNTQTHRLIYESSSKNPDETAIIFHGGKITYRELNRYIERTASYLYKIGIRKGDVIAIYLPNCPQFIFSYYAIQKVGGIPTAVSFLYSPREVKHQLKDSGSKAIIMINLLYEKIKPAIEETGIKKVILTDILHFMPFFKRTLSVLLRKIPKSKDYRKKGIAYLEDIIKEEDVDYPQVEVSMNDIASLVYTAGTTGLPKGVPLTHYNLVANLYQIIYFSGGLFNDSENRYFLAYLPFFHVYGQVVIMTGGLSSGKTLVVVLKPDIKDLLRQVKKYKVSLLFGVPAFYAKVLKLVKKHKYDLLSLKICACGSDRISQDLADEFKMVTGVEIVEGYGLTEAGGGVLGVPVGGKVKRGSLGIPLPSTYVAVAHPEADEFIPVGEVGEIIVSGPQVVDQYWNNSNPNSHVIIAGRKWLRTGDYGYMDNDGYFFFVERKKDIIKYKGYSLYPGEVEKVIAEYEPIKEVAVVGVEDPDYGEIVKAFIVLKNGYENKVSMKDIIEWCKDKLAHYKIPKQVEFVESLPRDVMGKILRRKLKEKR